MKSNRRILILIVTLFVVLATYIDCASKYSLKSSSRSRSYLKKAAFLALKNEASVKKTEVAAATKTGSKSTLSNKLKNLYRPQIKILMKKLKALNFLLTNNISFYKKIIKYFQKR